MGASSDGLSLGRSYVPHAWITQTEVDRVALGVSDEETPRATPSRRAPCFHWIVQPLSGKSAHNITITNEQIGSLAPAIWRALSMFLHSADELPPPLAG